METETGKLIDQLQAYQQLAKDCCNGSTPVQLKSHIRSINRQIENTHDQIE